MTSLNARKVAVPAWVLLSVWMPMLLISALHIHSDVQPAVDCNQCVQHVHHSGHITQGGSSIDDCVICHILHQPFIAAKAVKATCCQVGRMVVVDVVPPMCSIVGGVVTLRAPPV